MNELAVAAMLLTLSVVVLGAIDGIYFHLVKFRLHARPESAREHFIHAIRATLAGPTMYLLFVGPGAGRWLWLAAALVATDFGVQLWDLVEERRSRKSLGGIPPAEYAIHVTAAALHGAAEALALAARPLSAWSPGAAAVEQSPLVVALANVLWPGAVALALLHFALMVPSVARRLPA